MIQYYRYAELSLRYQDIILGSLFGVSNVSKYVAEQRVDSACLALER